MQGAQGPGSQRDAAPCAVQVKPISSSAVLCQHLCWTGVPCEDLPSPQSPSCCSLMQLPVEQKRYISETVPSPSSSALWQLFVLCVKPICKQLCISQTCFRLTQFDLS